MIAWLLHVGGIDDVSGHWYAFWSGFAGDLPEFAAVAIFWRRINCHAKGCPRIGLHRVTGTHFTTCRKHHPDHDGSKPYTAEQISEHRKEKA